MEIGHLRRHLPAIFHEKFRSNGLEQPGPTVAISRLKKHVVPTWWLLAEHESLGGRPELWPQHEVDEEVGRGVDADEKVAGVDEELDDQAVDLHG